MNAKKERRKWRWKSTSVKKKDDGKLLVKKNLKMKKNLKKNFDEEKKLIIAYKWKDALMKRCLLYEVKDAIQKKL